MNLKQRLETALHDAMRAGDTTAKETIRMALASIKFNEVQKGSALEENDVLNLLQKEIKSRKETIVDAEKAHRQDIITQTQSEIKIIETFLPQQLSEEELKGIILQAINEINAQNVSDMGKVMKIVLPKLQGKAPNDAVSKIVKELLNK